MVLDYGLAWGIEILTKYLLADHSPKDIVLKGMDRRDARRLKREADEAEKKRIEEETTTLEKNKDQ